MPVYKKNGKYYASFYYTRWDGKKIKKKKEGFKTKKEAMLYEKEFLLKEEGGVELSFEILVEKYLEDSKARVKPTTYELSKYIINSKILPHFKELKINEIEAITIREWQNMLLTDDKKYSQTYLKTLNNRLNAIFNYGEKYLKVTKNPCKLCGSIGKKNSTTMQFWTNEEYKKFVKGIENKPLTKIMYEILFYTGIRLGELLALTLDDFDFENKIMSINKTYTRLKGKDLIQEPKTPKSRREIIIPKFLAEDIKEFSKKRYDYKSDERLFPVTKFYLHHEMKRGTKKTGVKKIRIHDLRHSHASLLVEMGLSPKD